MFGIFKKIRNTEFHAARPLKKYKLGLALGGGGVKGAAHCGALQALYEYGLEPDIIAGTSAGSIVGALYASGMKPVEICNLFINKDIKDLISFNLPRTGFFDQTPLIKYLHKILPVETFEELKKPLLVIACDLDAGATKVFDRGELAPRIMASCSIPVIFRPTVVDGVNYVDGGVFMNLPATPLREDCEKLIGISVHASITHEYKKNLLGVASRSFYLMFVSNTIDESKKCDMYIDINTVEYSPYNLNNIEKLFNIGYQTTVKALEENGYMRVRPSEEIVFATKKGSKNIVSEELEAVL